MNDYCEHGRTVGTCMYCADKTSGPTDLKYADVKVDQWGDMATLTDVADVKVGYRVRYRIDSHIWKDNHQPTLCNYPLPAYFAYFPHKATCRQCLAAYAAHLRLHERIVFELKVLHARFVRWRNR